MKEPRRPMPDALRQRLRAIPREEVLCRDVERLYGAARARAFGSVVPAARPESVAPKALADGPAERHLEECSRCHELYVTLGCAFNLRPLPLPRRLARNLRDLARHPERLLPVWIADTRYAAAACYLLAALALSVAGDASALFRDTRTTVSIKAQVWVDEGEARGLEAWDAAAAALGKSIDDGWNTASRYGASCEQLVTGALKKLEAGTQKMIPGRERPVEGDHDGKTGNDPE